MRLRIQIPDLRDYLMSRGARKRASASTRSFDMKKIVFATLAAATVFASVGAASAQTVQRHWQEASLSLNTGGASVGYNQTIQSFDNIK
jgi:hypothetical protein